MAPEPNEHPKGRPSKTGPLRGIDMPRERLPKHVKELIQINNSIQLAAESIYRLVNWMVEQEKNRY